MATGMKTGLNPARKRGSGVDNQGVTEYDIANTYGTDLGMGHLVKLNGGVLEEAAAGEDAVGVLNGVSYTKADGTPTEALYWPASTNSATQPKGRVCDDPNATFLVRANDPLTIADGGAIDVAVGDLFALDPLSVDAFTGRCEAEADVAGGIVLLAAAHIKVERIVDLENYVLEVSIANHVFRDNV